MSDKKEPDNQEESSDKGKEKLPDTTTAASGSSKGAMSVSVAEDAVEQIRRYLGKKLGLVDDDEDESDANDPKVLDDVSVEGIVNYIQKNNCKNIITLAGAGISTSAGIPDFRSPSTGLYANLAQYKLPNPQAIFDIDYFDSNPKPFYVLAKNLYPGEFKPTLCHYFVRLLNQKGLLLRHYTQNIDTLERIAGIPEDKLVEAHGTFNTGHCRNCHADYTQDWMRDEIFADRIPKCTKCKSGIVKPDIVFFGENLPDKFYKCTETDFDKCDLLIVMGSSLVVQPFASLIDRVSKTCPRLLINREKAGGRDRIMKMLNIGGGMDFDGEKNSRDVAYIGDCDDGCKDLAKKLGWESELNELIESEYKRLEPEPSK